MGKTPCWKTLANEQKQLSRRDEAQPIGRTYSQPRVTTTSATWIAHSAGPQSVLIYHDEIPIIRTEIDRTIEYHEERVNIQTQRSHLIKYRTSWWRDEYSIEKRHHSIKPGFHLVRASWPYAAYRVGYASFKASMQSSVNFIIGDASKPWQRTYSDMEYVFSVGGLRERIETFENDYWCDENLLVAANFLSPLPVDAAGKMRRKKKTHWILGVCEDFNRHHKELTDSREVKRLLYFTEKNRIMFTHRKAALDLKLWPETILQRENIMQIAIAQALSGLDEKHERFRGGAVTKLVSKLYRNGLDRYNSRISTQRRGERDARIEEQQLLIDKMRAVAFKY